MVHSDRGDQLGGVILPSTVEWADVEPGSVLMGSDNRSVLFGGVGPKHEVVIKYPFRISIRPVPLIEAHRMMESSEVEIASESEWGARTLQRASNCWRRNCGKLLLIRHKTIGARHVMAGLIVGRDRLLTYSESG